MYHGVDVVPALAGGADGAAGGAAGSAAEGRCCCPWW